MTTHVLTAADGWVLLTDAAGSHTVALASQGPVWLEVATSAPAASAYSGYVLERADGDGEENQSLSFTLGASDNLYAKANRSQTVTLNAATDDTALGAQVTALAAQVAALAALVGTAADDSADATVFGLLAKIDANNPGP